MIKALQLGETEQNCYSILARLFPGQSAATLLPVMKQNDSVTTPREGLKKRLAPVTSSSKQLAPATPPREVLTKAETFPWEVLTKPLPPIGQEKSFNREISEAKKQVWWLVKIMMLVYVLQANKSVLNVLTVSPSFPPPSPVIPISPSKLLQ